MDEISSCEAPATEGRLNPSAANSRKELRVLIFTTQFFSTTRLAMLHHSTAINQRKAAPDRINLLHYRQYSRVTEYGIYIPHLIDPNPEDSIIGQKSPCIDLWKGAHCSIDSTRVRRRKRYIARTNGSHVLNCRAVGILSSFLGERVYVCYFFVPCPLPVI